MLTYLPVNRRVHFLHFRDAPIHDASYRMIKCVDFLRRELTDERFGMDLCIEQDLIGICIADRAHDRMIVDEDAYLLARMRRGQRSKQVNGKFRTPNVGSLGRVFGNRIKVSVCNHIRLCHFLLITHVEPGSVIEMQRETDVARRFFAKFLMLQTTHEHQVEDKVDRIRHPEIDERAMKLDPGHSPVLQSCIEGFVDAHSDCDGLLHGGLCYGSSNKIALEIFVDEEKIRKFGHVTEQ